MTFGLNVNQEFINHAAMVTGAIGLGLTLLNHYFRNKEIEKMARLISGRVVPKAVSTWRKNRMDKMEKTEENKPNDHTENDVKDEKTE